MTKSNANPGYNDVDKVNNMQYTTKQKFHLLNV